MLRSCYRRLKMKARNSESGCFPTRWPLFTKLSFLSEANTKSNIHSLPLHGTKYESILKLTQHSSPLPGIIHVTSLGATSGHGSEVVGQDSVITQRLIKEETVNILCIFCVRVCTMFYTVDLIQIV